MKRTLILSVVLTLVLMANCVAQPVVLTCTSPNDHSEWKITFDEAAGTASFMDQDFTSATFTDREITWKNRIVGGGIETSYQFSLSRMTGTLTVHGQCYPTMKGVGCSTHSSSILQCEASQKKF
jgi:opacity protein-like surface antigen